MSVEVGRLQSHQNTKSAQKRHRIINIGTSVKRMPVVFFAPRSVHVEVSFHRRDKAGDF